MSRAVSRVTFVALTGLIASVFSVIAPNAGAAEDIGLFGVFRDGSWFVDQNSSGGWDGCGVDRCGTFGQAGDDALVTPDGEFGVYRDGLWFVDANNSGDWDGCWIDRCGTFGLPDDVPVITADGKIGVYRDGQWFVDQNNSGDWNTCAVDRCGSFGSPGDLPVITADNKFGVYRNGLWFVDQNDSGDWDGCGVDRCASFGNPGDQPVVTPDNKFGVYRNGLWFVDQNDSGDWDGCGVDRCASFGSPGDIAFVVTGASGGSGGPGGGDQQPFGSGTHLVNVDIEPGRYMANPTGPLCNWQRRKDAPPPGNVLAVGSSNADRMVVDILPTDYAFANGSCGTFSPWVAQPQSGIPDGEWVVNDEIQPGVWRAPAIERCKWTRLTGFAGTPGERIETGNHMGSPVTVTIVSSDEGFTSDGCGGWTKIG